MTMTQFICSVVFNRHFECYVSYILLWNLLNTAADTAYIKDLDPENR